jgi:molybdenum cofactor cytidylyltransferase
MAAILTQRRNVRIGSTIACVIPAVVLAAGLSSRMGRPKAMLPIGGDDTFLTRIVRTFSDAGVDDVVVVVGHRADEVRATFDRSGLAARFVYNAAFSSGQLSSLLAGLRAIDRPGVEAMLVTLVDVPLVETSTVRAVLDRYRHTHAPIVRPTNGSRHGHPVLFDRSMFSALSHADPAAGAKSIVREHASAAGDVAVDDNGAFMDVDTPEEYARYFSSSSSD